MVGASKPSASMALSIAASSSGWASARKSGANMRRYSSRCAIAYSPWPAFAATYRIVSRSTRSRARAGSAVSSAWPTSSQAVVAIET
jgi:hypothetical protein